MRTEKMIAVISCMIIAVWGNSVLIMAAGKNEARLLQRRLAPAMAFAATDAPAGFDNSTNGLTDQATFDQDRLVFEERESIADGLGPVFNGTSCGECHQNPVTGGNSQVTELRAGRFDGQQFTEPPGGSLIHDRAIDPAMQEVVLPRNNVRALRASLSLLGAGFIEAISDGTLQSMAFDQPTQSGGRIAGEIIEVPVLEAEGQVRVGRFGWKNQHASLVSFAADAYRNEMGITSPLIPSENASNGQSVEAFDQVADPEDNGDDVETFARFMRATKVPPRDAALAATPEAQTGVQLFANVGCGICHVGSITTMPAGSQINGDRFVVPEALGDKTIHPFSDFLLHDVGTGDGIVQNGPASTRNKLRTAPLWGLRTRNRFLHDHRVLTINEAILQHAGEATFVIDNYRDLTPAQRQMILAFLRSL